VRRKGNGKKGIADQAGVNSTVIVRGRGRLFPIGVTERGQEIVSNWRAVRGLRIPRSSYGFFFLSLSLFLCFFLSHRAVSSRTCRVDPGIVVQIQQKPKSPSPPVLYLSLLPNLANPLEIATCGREAAQLIYVVSEALTRKREKARPLVSHCIPPALRIRARVRHCHNLE